MHYKAVNLMIRTYEKGQNNGLCKRKGGFHLAIL